MKLPVVNLPIKLRFVNMLQHRILQQLGEHLYYFCFVSFSLVIKTSADLTSMKKSICSIYSIWYISIKVVTVLTLSSATF